MNILKRFTLVGATLLISSVSTVGMAAAIDETTAADTTLTTQSTTTNSSKASEARAAAVSKQAEAKAKAEDRIAATKLKVCQTRDASINKILSRIADRGQKQLDLFTTIATRTETFYTTKGNTLSMYDSLVADVTAKQKDAQTAVDTIKSESVTFKCDGTDPKGAVTSFKTALKSEISALKAYRTSVKNLIVGVKSVNSTDKTTSTTTTTTTNTSTGGTN